MAQHDTKWENTINEASELYQRIAELEAENARLRDAATDLSDVVDNAGLHAMFARQIDALRAALGCEMNADNLLDYLLDKLDNFINPYRRNLFITPEQRAVLIESIEAAEREAYNKAIADARKALAQEQTEMPVSRHDAEENQVLDRAIEIVNALTK